MGKMKPMQDVAYTPEEARKLAKTVALGQMYGAGPNTLNGIKADSVIFDEIEKISAIFGIDLMKQIQIHQLEDTKIKRLLYGKSDKTNI